MNIEQQINDANEIQQAGNPEQAYQTVQAVLKEQPGNLKAHLIAANSALLVQNYRQAIPHLQILLNTQPKQAQIRKNLSQCWNNIARVHIGKSEYKEAEQAFRQAFAVWPENLDAGFNYALLAIKVEKLASARQLLQACLQLDADFLDAKLELIQVQIQLRSVEEAILLLTNLDNADLEPCLPYAERIANLWLQCGQTEKFRFWMRKKLEDLPGAFRDLSAAALSHDHVYENQKHLDSERDAVFKGLEWLSKHSGNIENLDQSNWSNFFLAYQGENDLEFQQKYGSILQEQLARVYPEKTPEKLSHASNGDLKLLMVSSFFRDCTVGHYFKSWISGLKDRGFEVTVYQLGPQKDDMTTALINQADKGEIIENQDDLLARIQSDQPDMILYPEIGMDTRILPLAALRLAPVQCSAWGHPVTTGLDTIDAYITCAEMEPENAQEHYSEKLIELPGIGTSYQPANANLVLTHEDVNLSEDRQYMLMPQSAIKVHPDCDRLWAEIIKTVPDVDLIVFEDQSQIWFEKFLNRLKQNMPGERIRVFKGMPRAHYLALAQLCSIMVDSLYFSGGNTSLDALAVGLPIVTLPGQLMRGRQTSAMLKRLDLGEWVADDEKDYIGKAVQLLNQADIRQAYSQKILRQHHKLFQDEKPVAVLAEKLKQLAQAQ